MKRIFVLFLLLSSALLQAQPYAIGRVTVTFIDSSRSNRSIPTEIYYPANQAGNNVPVATGAELKFPVLAFGHGFVMTWDAYQNVWETVVPEGFIIALPKSEGSFSPSHLEFAKDLAFVIEAMEQLGNNSASIFHNRIDSMNCVVGHSMGGGSAFLAASLSNKIKTIATLAAAETNPSAIQAAGSLQIPALIFAGANDCVTPPANHQLPMYQGLGSACKTYISITGGSHCQMAESNFYCNFGEATCTPAPSISRAKQHEIMFRYLIPWLKYNLKGDCAAANTFNTSITSDSEITFQKNCALCPPVNLTEEDRGMLPFFPNPFRDELRLEDATSQQCVILDSQARIIWKGPSNDRFTLNTSEWAKGVYYFEILQSDGRLIQGKLLKI